MATGRLRTQLLAVLMLMTASATVHAERLPIKVYTTADGLAHNTVNRIVRDSRGFLWFCTDDGLSRFDGYTFKTYGTEHGLPHSSVTDFLETNGGDLWVATKAGLVRFDPMGAPTGGQDPRQPARPMFREVASDKAYAGASHVTVLYQARDATIWIGTYNGLYRLEQWRGLDSLRRIDARMPDAFPEQSEVTDILEDSQGTLWISALSGLYRRWPDGSAARYTDRNGLPSAALIDLFEDRTGHLWAGTMDRGFFGFSAGAGPAAPVVDRVFNQADGLPSYWVFGLFETSDGRFWVATANGLAEFLPSGDPLGRRFRSYGHANGVTDTQIYAVAEDLAGNLWLGTGSAGAMKVAHGGFTTFGELDAVQSVFAIFEDSGGRPCFRGTVLGDRVKTVFEGAVLTLGGHEERFSHGRFGCFDGSRITWFYPSAITSFGWVGEGTTLRTRNGEWWIGTGDGIYRYAPVSRMSDLTSARPMALYSTQDGLPAPQVYQLFEDSRGDIWVSTTSAPTQGLARWDHASGRLHDLTHAPNVPSLTDNTPRAFGEDRAGSIWIGFNRGLARYKDGRFTLFSTAEGLPPGQVRDIHLDRRGRLWLASGQGGLVRVEDDGQRVTFVSYTTAQGLSSSNTTTIAEDSQGRILVGGGRGLDRLDPGSGQVRHFTNADGLAPGVLRAALATRGGALWFGTTQGLSRLVPAEGTDATGPPPIFIDGVRVRGVPQRVSVRGERELSLASLSPQQNQLQIDFVGLSFESGETLRYQYRLGDAEWSAPAGERSVTFASLSPGRYTFLVRAIDADGVTSREPAAVTFTIQPPVWLRWWFLVLMGTAGAMTVHGLYRYRLSRLLEIANMRTRIATDLHDDIGANLTRIALLSEVAQQAAGARDAGAARHTGPDVDNGLLASIARIARESVASMSDIVWAINPQRETLVDLTRRMRQHADELFTLRDIELRFAASAGSEGTRLGVDVRRDLLLIFKEIVSNVARHSRCSAVDIEFSRAGSRLILRVADNGVGFDPAVASDGQGRSSVARRVQRLGGTLDITTTKGRGTSVTVAVPM